MLTMSLFSEKVEKDYERQVISRLKKHGFASHIETSIPGFPDIVYLSGNQVRLIEMKRGKNIATLLRASQKAFHAVLKRYGVIVYVILVNNGVFTLYIDNAIILSGNVDEVVEYVIK